jgi:hypothetical protein
MNMKLFVIVGLLVVAAAVMVAPVAAVTTGTTTITGNPAAEIAITVQGNISNWALNLGSNSDALSVKLNVDSNRQKWAVNVKDALDKDSGNNTKTHAGQMVDYNNATNLWGTGALATPMDVGAAGVNPHVTGSTVTLTGGEQAIETGADDPESIGIFPNIAITISQQVHATDPILGTDHVYRIIVTFIGGLT